MRLLLPDLPGLARGKREQIMTATLTARGIGINHATGLPRHGTA
jgi:hypothetical protein